MATQPITKITEEEYLRMDRTAEVKSEFVGCEIFLKPGGSFRHSRLIMNWSTELQNKLRGSQCLPFSSDTRIRTPGTGSYVYPDVSVVCGKPVAFAGSSDILTNPRLAIEVLSPSTADYDRGKKFELYQEIPSFAEYVLVHQDALHVEQYTRQADGNWILQEYKHEGSVVTLTSINCSVLLSDVYSELPA